MLAEDRLDTLEQQRSAGDTSRGQCRAPQKPLPAMPATPGMGLPSWLTYPVAEGAAASGVAGTAVEGAE